jgi:hypothetical protein
MVAYRTILGEWGQLFECALCGSLVYDRILHDKWHEGPQYSEAAKTAARKLRAKIEDKLVEGEYAA